MGLKLKDNGGAGIVATSLKQGQIGRVVSDDYRNHLVIRTDVDDADFELVSISTGYAFSEDAGNKMRVVLVEPGSELVVDR